MSETAVEKKQAPIVPAFDIASTTKLPNLHTNGVVVPADYVAEYWSPEEGEVVRGYIQSIVVEKFPDMKDASKLVDVKVVKLISQNKNGDAQNIMNASKRLVSVVEKAFQNGIMQSGTPVEISCLGEVQNKSNGFKSMRWSVKPIAINGN